MKYLISKSTLKKVQIFVDSHSKDLDIEPICCEFLDVPKNEKMDFLE